MDVCEQALDRELRQAQIAGEKVGHEKGMVFAAPSEADAQRFLVEYNAVAEQNARLAGRYDIDGLRLFQYARALVANATRVGEVECVGEKE